ncbi:hypothetical protein [Bittarella massiliensis (ex Durand et al. 2017)]|uniref:hypothetical protein n=1 Tax=Bittarella massiliensis (ex Durand et al. 2017) TaxID=1720313 RepID=UPI001AA0C8EA|nr:hypothetical protein [Bittarella massiliensis (ex Durand et al. 2017)]MBO1679239.1 hypothetical protein [Bittarella massiliensis (ex Durand et al. 2017)]
MTEREWRELPHLQREVKLLQGQLERLRRAQERWAVRRPCEGEMAQEEIGAEMRELERRLQAAVRGYLLRVEEGYGFLGEVEDSQMRQILNLRYLEGMSWQRVAFAIGEYDEQYPRKKCRRFWAKEEGRI